MANDRKPRFQAKVAGNAALTWDQAQEIRDLHRNKGISQVTLARTFNVSQATISRILHDKIWNRPLPKFIREKPLPKTHKPSIEEFFWSRVDQSGGSDACWPWIGRHMPSGYGRVTFGGKEMYTHRLAYELSKGAIPEGLFICHSCDNPPCCNPSHLWIGTAADNAHDRHIKGRNGKGYGVKANAKLTVEQVAQIRQMYSTGNYSQTALAHLFGVKSSALSAIVRGKTWPDENYQPFSDVEGYRKRQGEATRQRHQLSKQDRSSTSAELRALRAARIKEAMAKPEVRERQLAIMNSPEYKAKQSAAAKAAHARKKATQENNT